MVKKLTVPVLDSMKWTMDVGMEKAILAAERRTEAILTTIELVMPLALVTVGGAESLLLEENDKVLVTKFQPGSKWVRSSLDSVDSY
jgi:hypothetical protein